MFIETYVSGYNRDGQQYASGRFLILMHPNTPDGLKQPIRARVVYTRMRQLGHFMMGIARIDNHRISLSGTYGNDGLTVDMPIEVYQKGVEVPAELVEAWNKGGGWNSAGSEGPAMREWATKTFAKKGLPR